MKDKKTKIVILITFLIALLLSFIIALFNISDFKFGSKNFIIDWPTINTEPLNKSINSYEGDFDHEEFEYEFNKQLQTNIPKESINTKYTYEKNSITIDLSTDLEFYENKTILNPDKKYIINLEDKLMI